VPKLAANLYTPSQRHTLLLATLLGLGGLVVFGLIEYLSAFLGAGILYVAFRPWYTALVHGRGWNRQLVAAGLLGFTVVLLVVPCYALSVMLFDRLRHAGHYPDQVLAVVHRLERLSGYSVTNEQTVRTLLGQATGYVSRWLLTLAGSVLQLAVVLGLLLFTLYFMLVREEALLRALRRYLPFRPATLDKLRAALQANVQANVLGQGLISAVQGVLTGLLLGVFGVPDPFFWGIVGFFVAFVPVLGTPLVWGPAALYQFAQGATGAGVGILVVGAVVVMNADNLLRIVLAQRLGHIHPLVTLAGITLGVTLFGVAGLVVGPLLLSSLGVLLDVFALENRRKRTAKRAAKAKRQGPGRSAAAGPAAHATPASQ